MQFSPYTRECLQNAGWREGRKVNTELYQHALRGEGYPIHYARVLAFLTKFGGLVIAYAVQDGQQRRLTLRIDPKRAFRVTKREEVKRHMKRAREADGCLLGTCRSGEMALVMAASGRVYGICQGRLWRVAASGEEAIQAICDDHALLPVK